MESKNDIKDIKDIKDIEDIKDMQQLKKNLMKKYRDKKTLMEYLKIMLHSKKPRELLDWKEKRMILDLLVFHRSRKYQVEDVAEIFVDLNLWNRNSFYVFLMDGRVDDFSYKNLANYLYEQDAYDTKIRYHKVKGAFRNAVLYQIAKFRQEHAAQDTCPLCQTSFKETRYEIDHEKVTFEEIFISFANECFGGDLLKMMEVPISRAFQISDEGILNAFQKFHFQRAKLRKICKPCNQQLGKQWLNSKEREQLMRPFIQRLQTPEEPIQG